MTAMQTALLPLQLRLVLAIDTSSTRADCLRSMGWSAPLYSHGLGGQIDVGFHKPTERTMKEIKRIGVDLGKRGLPRELGEELGGGWTAA